MDQIKRYFSLKIAKSEQAKMLFQYLLVVIVSIIAGLFLARSTSLSFLCERAVQHFALPFYHCTSFREVSLEYLRYSLSDLICATLLLVSSFSLLNCLSSEFILAFQGLRFGVALTAVFSIHSFGYLGERLSLLLFRFGIISCFVFCAYHLSRFSYEFRKNLKSGRLTLSPKNTIPLFGIFLFLTSAILLFNILYCGIIFLI